MIHLTNVEKNYGDYSLNISMDIPAGKVTGLVGRNGAGKSTTIKAILGLIRTDSGTVTTLGKPVSALSAADREMIGVALSDSGFSSYFCCEDIIAILRAMYTRFDEKMFRDICAANNLPMNKRIREFSTGMLAKLKVLCAITHQAKLLILDEPTAGLDVIARNDVLDLLRDYLEADPERTLLISSHISSDLEGLCDDLYMIHDGRVVLHEDTDVLLGEYAVLKVSRQRYEEIDHSYLLKVKEESSGYSCFTSQRQYYMENYPDLVIESGNIDDLIIMMSSGRSI